MSNGPNYTRTPRAAIVAELSRYDTPGIGVECALSAAPRLCVVEHAVGTRVPTARLQSISV